ncbi:MAG: bacteriohemerythrin [Desulfuromonadales bacterium]
MQVFQWEPSFETGNLEIDRQHQYLIGIINDFGELLERGVVNPAEISKVCVQLADYARYHFGVEEQLMASVNLDQRHHYQHRHQHEELLYETALFQRLLAAGDQAEGRIFFEFLTNWLVFHILGTDMLMSRQIEAIGRGKTAAEAFLVEEHADRNATALLLAAVKKLVTQISSRNRQLIELNESLEQKVVARTRDLSELNQQLKLLANTDGLTGVLNRRAFMEEAGSLLQLAQRYRHPLSLLMVDADHFKRVNDTCGHEAGDRVLVALGKIMHQSLRGTDRLGRIGGEEFAILLPETDLEQTAVLAERLLSSVRHAQIEINGGAPLTITVSIGVATLNPLTADIDAIMRAADAALYRAKAAGRDRWCGAD